MEEENSTPKSPESAGSSGQEEQSASAEPAEVKSTEESPAPSKDARMWAMFCHLGGLAGFVFPFGNIILPLIFWQVKKEEEFPFTDQQGKEAVNIVCACGRRYMCYYLHRDGSDTFRCDRGGHS